MRRVVAFLIAFMLSSCVAGITGVHAQVTPVWRVEGDALLRVGTSPDDRLDQLDRVSAALWLGARGLVIANHGDEVRYYDATGRHRVTSGRSGSGPGEFRALRWLGAAGDSTIVAYDATLQRVSILSSTGAFLRSFQLNDSDLGAAPTVAGVLDDGSVLTLWHIRGAALRGGLSRGLLRLVLFSTTGEVVRTVGEGPGTEALLIPRGPGFALRRPPFRSTPRYAVSGAHIYHTDGVSYAVRTRDAHGRELGTIGDPDRRVEITEEIRRAFLRDTLRHWPPGERSRIEASMRSMMVHEYLPIVADMRVDDQGYVWLRGRDTGGPAAH